MPFGNRLWLIEYDLDRMGSYISHIHKLLSTELEQFERETEEFAASLSEADRDDFYEYKSEEYQGLKTDMPRQMYASFVVSLYSFVEDELLRVCDLTKATINVGVRDQKDLGKGINRARMFLKEGKGYEIDQRHWQELTDLNKLRNRLAHGSADLKRFIEKPKLDNAQYVTLNVDDEEHYVQIQNSLYNYLRRHNMLGYNGTYYISPSIEYCKQLVDFGKQLFRKIYADLKI